MLTLELLIVSEGEIGVAERIDEQRKGELGRAAPAVAPGEAGGTVLAQVELQRQWMTFGSRRSISCRGCLKPDLSLLLAPHHSMVATSGKVWSAQAAQALVA